MSSRQYDIALFGATGFTGQLIADYLVKHVSEEGVSLVLAGRNNDKGRALIQKLRAENQYSAPITWVRADVDDQDSLNKLMQSARVLINVVGPFALYAPNVVKACVENGCHYLDITGEPTFYHDVIDKRHEQAKNNKVCIVNACGFDSIPADLGTLEAVKKLKSKTVVTARAYIHTNAHFSGGTWTTAILGMRRNFQQKKGGANKIKTSTRKIPLKIHFHTELKRWALPMPVLDPHVVKRSSKRMPQHYGSSFAYGQFYTVGSFWKMIKLIFSVSMMFLLTRFSWGVKYLLSKNLPGTGPSKSQRDKSKFKVYVFAESDSEKSQVVVSGGDPGYNETSKMLSQSAFCLLEKLKTDTLKFGVLTPAEALGESLIERLRKEGMKIE
jgi:short subunit dehydrogenase-like uncharacterized protein